MADMTLTAQGAIVAEPNLRFTQGGSAVCSFRIAVADRRKVNNEWTEKTTFLSCTAWGSLGENIANSCSKGTRVIVTGNLEQRDYETDGGEKRTVLELKVDECAPSLKWATVEVTRNERKAER